LEYKRFRDELSTIEWLSLINEAVDMGILQISFIGGEPLLRKDLEQLVKHARAKDLYVHLITNGLTLNKDRLQELSSAIDMLQISLQGPDAETCKLITGVDCFKRKVEAAKLAKQAGKWLTLNVPIHRINIDRIGEMIDLALRLGADCIEIANVLYYGWALHNMSVLLPTKSQLSKAEEIIFSRMKELNGQLRVKYVPPDGLTDWPRDCAGGWAKDYLTINPSGFVLPCLMADQIPELKFENVRNCSLRQIWHNSVVLNKFRGYDWMPEPCRSCDRKEIDFGGCRCLAYFFAGDIHVTDPMCKLSPFHSKIEKMISLDRNDDSSPVRYRFEHQLGFV
jgi:pyrroloquinoline quinone biosynthesis protein E